MKKRVIILRAAACLLLILYKTECFRRKHQTVTPEPVVYECSDRSKRTVVISLLPTDDYCVWNPERPEYWQTYNRIREGMKQAMESSDMDLVWDWEEQEGLMYRFEDLNYLDYQNTETLYEGIGSTVLQNIPVRRVMQKYDAENALFVVFVYERSPERLFEHTASKDCYTGGSASYAYLYDYKLIIVETGAKERENLTEMFADAIEDVFTV